MLSGQGRHRRPRQAPAIVVAAGVTGSAIAIPLLGATGAHAADATTWDKVAECESGGAWSAKGEGYYGGLQLTQETWESYGGLAYAPSADQASRSQQIAVADKVLADQGPSAWPNCGPAAGLSKGGAAADVDPGLPPAPSKPAEPSGDAEDSQGDGKGSEDGEKADGADKGAEDSADASDKGDKGDRGSTGKHRKPDSGGSADESDERDKAGRKGEKGAADGKSGDRDSTSPDAESDPGREPSGADESAEGSEGSPSGRHRGSSADEGDGVQKGGAGSAGRHASRGEGRDARDAADPADTYTVRSGDNLSQIADRHDLDGGWTTLYAENKRTVGGDPDLILPGQRLDLRERQAAEADRK
ncbi:transglycosylase family protein [Streptomyces flavofungini]|uniref:transglycosylase family protein n=1 Tax=Streptomyces flavofungini TaxID=68200 RepID=UPI0025AF3C39|nr:transglycosylase family protein [Streptomyces flavofungini]WJV48246.1 transglycosylase family protein [Streptomyces flavofungini]